MTKAERHSSSGLRSLPNCYAFISQQIYSGIKITIEITSVEEYNSWKESFIFGLTNANPETLTANDLPNNVQHLIQRKHQFWALIDNFCDKCYVSDKLSFFITSKGFVCFSINSNGLLKLFPIKNCNQNLWAFFNIIGRIKAIKLVDNTCYAIPNAVENFRKRGLKFGNFNINSTKHLYKCINCSDFANTAFYDCGHKYYCFNCAKQYNKCPICSQVIYDLLIIFP